MDPKLSFKCEHFQSLKIISFSQHHNITVESSMNIAIKSNALLAILHPISLTKSQIVMGW